MKNAPGFEDEMDAKVDGLLKRYFEAEMPRPWPAWQPPGAISPLKPAQDNLMRSRLTLVLAMSLMVAFVSLIGSMVGGAPNGVVRPEKGIVEQGTAKIPKELMKDKK